MLVIITITAVLNEWSRVLAKPGIMD